MTHRILVPLLTAALLLTGCGHHDADTTDTDPETPTPSASVSPTPTLTPSATPRVKKAHPRGVDKATYPVKDPSTMSIEQKVMARFVVMANSPDTRTDPTTTAGWGDALKVSEPHGGVGDDLSSGSGPDTSTWWKDAAHHDGWVSVHISHIAPDEPQDPTDPSPDTTPAYRVMFTTTLHRDDGDITEVTPHIWDISTVSKENLSIAHVDFMQGPSTIVPWWRVPKVPFPVTTSDGHAPTSRDILGIRTAWQFVSTRHTVDPHKTYPGFDVNKYYSLTTGDQRVISAYEVRDWKAPRNRDVEAFRSTPAESVTGTSAELSGTSMTLTYAIHGGYKPDPEAKATISTDLCPGTDNALCVSQADGVDR